MGCTACTEPQCLYKGALYILPYLYFYCWYVQWSVTCYQIYTSLFEIHRNSKLPSYNECACDVPEPWYRGTGCIIHVGFPNICTLCAV